MPVRSFRRLVSILGLLALVVLVGASSASIAGAGKKNCKKVEGQISIQPLDPGQCSSEFGCATGTIKGDIKGTFDVVTTSIVESPDFAETGVAFTAADTVFTTSSGTLLSKDAAAISTSSGAYAEVITIIGGTKSYSGVTGTLTSTGVATPTGGSGTWSGTICLP